MLESPFRYEVAVSYAREDGDYVSAVVVHLRDEELTLFFDRSEEIELWGRDLYAELAEIYGGAAACCVMFLSKWYRQKVWTNYERRVIQLRALIGDSHRVLPARLDETEIPGFPSGILFVDASQLSPKELAEKIVKKVNLLEGSTIRARAEVPLEDTGDGYGRYRLVIVYDPTWFGGGAYALARDGRRYRLARITPGIDELNRFNGTACALMFDVEPRITLDWVKIEELRVKVNAYRPLPAYEPLLPAPYETAHVYYAEIDREPAIYRADYYVKDGRRDIGFVRLFRGRPETVVIRINAKTPGIYNFDVEMLCAGRDEQALITLVAAEEFLFDR